VCIDSVYKFSMSENTYILYLVNLSIAVDAEASYFGMHRALPTLVTQTPNVCRQAKFTWHSPTLYPTIHFHIENTKISPIPSTAQAEPGLVVRTPPSTNSQIGLPSLYDMGCQTP